MECCEYCFNCFCSCEIQRGADKLKPDGRHARYGSLMLLFTGAILIFLSALYGYRIFENKPYGSNVGGCLGSLETCAGKLLAIKIGVALSLFFLFQLILSIFNFHRLIANFLSGCWLIKPCFFMVLLCGCYFLPPNSVIVFFYMFLPGSACYLIFQICILITFLMNINYGIVNDEHCDFCIEFPNRIKKLLLKAGLVLGLVLTIGILSISYVFFAACTLNLVFTFVSTGLAVALFVLTLVFHSTSSSVFTTSLIVAYCMFLNLTTLLANVDTTCERFPDLFSSTSSPPAPPQTLPQPPPPPQPEEQELEQEQNKDRDGDRDSAYGTEKGANVDENTYFAFLQSISTLSPFLSSSSSSFALLSVASSSSSSLTEQPLASPSPSPSSSLSFSSFPSTSSSSVSAHPSSSSSSSSSPPHGALLLLPPPVEMPLGTNWLTVVVKIIAFVALFAMQLYSAYDAAGVSSRGKECPCECDCDCECCKLFEYVNMDDTPDSLTERVDRLSGATGKRVFSHVRLNLVLMLASMHVAMVACGWGFNDFSALGGLKAGVGVSAMWVKCASTCLCVLLYTWMLLNPHIGPKCCCCCDREWPSTETDDKHCC